MSDAELRVKVDYSKSDLEGLREENYLPIIEGIATEAQVLAAALVGRWITAAHLVNFVLWNGKFRTLVSAPKANQTDISEANAKYDKLPGETTIRRRRRPVCRSRISTWAIWRHA